MFLGMLDCDFAQNLIKFAQILITFAQISPKFAHILHKSNQICQNLINFAQIKSFRGCGCVPSSYDTVQNRGVK